MLRHERRPSRTLRSRGSSLPNRSRCTLAPSTQTAAPARSSPSVKLRPRPICQARARRNASELPITLVSRLRSPAMACSAVVSTGATATRFGNLALDRLHVGQREGWRVRARASRIRVRRAGSHQQQIRAEPREVRAHLRGDARSHRHHRDHRGDADHDAQHRERRAQRIAPQRAQGEADEVAAHQSTSAWTAVGCFTQPSSNWMMRSARLATAGSWVTSAIGDAVAPSKLVEQLEDRAAAARVEVPGGFVREQQHRVADDGAGDRDALLLAARQFARRVPGAPGEPDRGERALRARPPLRAAASPVQQGQLHVLERGGAGQQLEVLEDEAQIAPPQQGALVARQLPDVGSQEAVGSARGHVEAAEDLQRGGFPRAARPDDRDELVRFDAQVDAPQRIDRRGALAVDPADALQDGERRRPACSASGARRIDDELSRRVRGRRCESPSSFRRRIPSRPRRAATCPVAAPTRAARRRARPRPGSRRTDACPGAARPGRRVAATPRVPAARSAALHWEPAAPGARAAPRSPPWPSSRVAAAARNCRPRPASRS